MDRKVFVLCTASGYLKDLDAYTDDPVEACFFVSYERAWKALLTARDRLNQRCWVSEALIPFPLPKPIGGFTGGC